MHRKQHLIRASLILGVPQREHDAERRSFSRLRLQLQSRVEQLGCDVFQDTQITPQVVRNFAPAFRALPIELVQTCDDLFQVLHPAGGLGLL